MNKFLPFFLALCFLNFLSAQEDEQEPHDQAIDSLAQNLEGQGVVIQEVTYEKKPINPLAPSKAAFYSAVLPGLGQLYNKRGAWWKIPAVYGGLATGVALYSFNNTEYNAARDAFKRRRAGFEDDEFFDINGDGQGPDISLDALQSAQENFQRTRDLWLVLTIVWYSLNIIEANVTAHLAQYNIDEQLSFDLQPYLNLDPVTNDPNYGMALVFKF
ncbi:DUF5683 domain-containing protein [Flagellimonas allohymeniacidonis]|uniref:DUF5683 domain-containing protein n=1 Tax=Flagellimonas allohymeniacidonis TaxID=2517819 RepID=A0A4Q8QKI5_9FLAO|nr:DUF5683 domain-containing protein [Allomuricauda hymeniacidonis]TAI49303.1 hypothetical protein EW142_05770 [Allomuricauda hymeniacidonis]